jgi:hypothetical protein
MNPDEQPVEDELRSLSGISTFGKNNNNGLLFAPTCTTCVNENKYLSMSEKKCVHQWNNECLNSTGEYVLFPSRMFHCEYYNDIFNTIFIQAQLFCAPTEYTNVLRLPQSIMKGKGKDVTRGHLDKSTLLELRDDLINNWDIHYSNPDYQPCKNFSGGPVDRMSNRQVYKKHFTQVTLLKKLMGTFETMFPYLFVDLEWLLHKSKEGDGFQEWHKDFLLGQQITKNIVINVGSKERDNEETTGSFNNNVSFKVDDWKEIEEYALSGLNLVDKLPQDEQNQAAFPTNNPSDSPSAIPHLKPSMKPVAILPENSGTIPPLHGKNDDYFAEDDRKPVAN